MEDKIKEGEYVRTETEGIRKVIGYDDDNNPFLDNQTILTKIEAKRVKHSKNIIDLIKVGDYVNGHLIVVNTKIRVICENGLFSYKNQDIKSIVTKEQFSQIEYKVEE